MYNLEHFVRHEGWAIRSTHETLPEAFSAQEAFLSYAIESGCHDDSIQVRITQTLHQEPLNIPQLRRELDDQDHYEESFF
jgi:hypothetical protein